MAGYSGTPLVRKLGIKAGHVVLAIAAPRGYAALLGELPDGARIVSRSTRAPDIVHLFCSERSELARRLPALRWRVVPDGAIWVSWPKQSSGLSTTVTEDVVRELALPLGLVDVKVCAVDGTWSGLRLVIRRELRPKPGRAPA